MKLFQLFENITLNYHQRYVLLQIKLADTPTLAFDQINKTEADYQARRILERVGLIRVSEDSRVAELTEDGEKAVIQYGLIDENGEVTEIGQQLLKDNQN